MDRNQFKKKLLAEFAYKLNKHRPFTLNVPWHVMATPTVGFWFNYSMSPKTIEKLEKNNILSPSTEDIIAILSDQKDSDKGIFLTTEAIYVNSPLNKDSKFKVSYYNIREVSSYVINNKRVLKIVTHSKKAYYITTPCFNKLNIKFIINFALGFNGFKTSEFNMIKDIKLSALNDQTVGSLIVGTIHGNAGGANNMWGMSRFSIPNTGHGFAAERMNHLYDILTGKNASIVGNDNATNGPDRLVDGVYLQSKYCATGQRCVESCFDKTTGNCRYINPDGKAMKIEVPSDKYDEAVKAMAEKIRQGKVPGYTNPEDAKEIIQKGHFTYEQAVNVAKAGTVESITYDAVNSMVICASVFGVTAVLTYATSIWKGDSFDEAVKQAAKAGIQVGGVSFFTNIIGAQLARSAGVMAIAQRISSRFVEMIGPKAAAVLANALRTGGVNIYGAAASKYLTKVLRNNIVTAFISAAILSAKDIKDIFCGRISAGQFTKNVGNTTASIVGGYIGYGYGTAAGAVIGGAIGGFTGGPAGAATGAKIGGLVGGLVGGAFGGLAATKVSGSILDYMIDDDSKLVVELINQEMVKLAQSYLLNQYEVENVGSNFTTHVKDTKGEILKDIFESKNRTFYIDNILQKYIDYELEYRPKISIPQSALEKTTTAIIKEALENINLDNTSIEQ